MFVFCQRPILVLETDRKYVQLLETKGPNESFHSKLLQTFIFQLEIWKWVQLQACIVELRGTTIIFNAEINLLLFIMQKFQIQIAPFVLGCLFGIFRFGRRQEKYLAHLYKIGTAYAYFQNRF